LAFLAARGKLRPHPVDFGLVGTVDRQRNGLVERT
jgi:hypothetical protein